METFYAGAVNAGLTLDSFQHILCSDFFFNDFVFCGLVDATVCPVTHGKNWQEELVSLLLELVSNLWQVLRQPPSNINLLY
jgi:hypothetical protein